MKTTYPHPSPTDPDHGEPADGASGFPDSRRLIGWARLALKGGATYGVAQLLTGLEAGMLTAGLHMGLGWSVPEALPVAVAASLPLLVLQTWALWRLTDPARRMAPTTRGREATIGMVSVAGFSVTSPMVLVLGALVLVLPMIALGIQPGSEAMSTLPGWLIATTGAAVFLGMAALAVGWASVAAWLRGGSMVDAARSVLAARATRRVQVGVALVAGLTMGWLPARLAAHLASSELWMEQVHAFLPSSHPESLPWMEAALASGSTLDQLALGAVVVLVGPLAEEVVFRGFLWGAMERWVPAWAVWLGTSMLFALAHADPIHTPAVLLIGLVLGALRWSSGSMWPGLLAHVLNNGLGVITTVTAIGAAGIPGVTAWTLGIMTLLVVALACTPRARVPTRPWDPRIGRVHPA